MRSSLVILILVACLSIVGGCGGETSTVNGSDSAGDSSPPDQQDVALLPDLSTPADTLSDLGPDDLAGETETTVAPLDAGDTNDDGADATIDGDDPSGDLVDASSKPQYSLDLDPSKLLFSHLTEQSIAVLGNLGIIRVNPTPAPHPGWKVQVTAVLANNTMGQSTSKAVTLKENDLGQVSLLALANGGHTFALTFVLEVSDSDNQIIDTQTTAPISFTLPINQTLVLEKALLAEDVKITIENGQALVAVGKDGLKAWDTLVVANISNGEIGETTLAPQGTDVSVSVAAEKGETLLIFAYTSTAKEKGSNYLQHLVE